MKVIGIIGPIAGGKTFISEHARILFGAKIFNADRVVTKLYHNDQELIKQIGKIVPSATINREINRAHLKNVLLHEPQKWRLIEHLVITKVIKELHKFLLIARRGRAKLVVLDIPLLLERNLHFLCDYLICSIAPHFTSNSRYLKRGGDPLVLNSLRLGQKKLAIKIAIADFIVYPLNKSAIALFLKSIINNKVFPPRKVSATMLHYDNYFM